MDLYMVRFDPRCLYALGNRQFGNLSRVSQVVDPHRVASTEVAL